MEDKTGVTRSRHLSEKAAGAFRQRATSGGKGATKLEGRLVFITSESLWDRRLDRRAIG